MKRVILVATMIGAVLYPATPALAVTCNVDASAFWIRREGIIFTNIVVIGEASAACPADNPTGVVELTVRVTGEYVGFAPEPGVYTGDGGTVSGYHKVKCFAEIPYWTSATAIGVAGAVGAGSDGPRSFSLNDCPPLPPVGLDP